MADLKTLKPSFSDLSYDEKLILIRDIRKDRLTTKVPPKVKKAKKKSKSTMMDMLGKLEGDELEEMIRKLEEKLK